jgi:uncharacterized protein YdaU (DUF1376 family)
MKDRPAYLPLYVRDWRSDAKVLLLPWDERALYLDMLLLAWELGPLPNDAHRIRTALGCPHDVTIIVTILVTMFVQGVDGWTNPRLEKERSRWSALHQANKSRLEAANAARAAKQTRDEARDEHRDEARDGFQAQAQAQEEEKTRSSLRSDLGASARGSLPGIELTPPKGKTEPSQAQMDGFVARRVWDRCWLSKYGTTFVGLKGRRSAAIRTAYVRVGRDEHTLETLVQRFLEAPPFKHRENPDPIALLDSLDGVRAGLNGKAGAAPRESSLAARNREGIKRIMEEL